MTAFLTFICILKYITCGSHLELGYLQKLINCGYTFNDYILKVSFKPIHWVMEYFAKMTNEL